MKHFTKVSAVIVLAAAVSSCAMNNEQAGALTGGVIGGLVGSQFGGGSGKVAAAAGGTMLGLIIGGNIGRTMDKVDRMKMQKALETAPTGRAVAWKNPDNGNRYSVKPTKTYYVESQPCREYVTTARIGGKREQIYGRACRQADGSWKIIR
jgi:surface antigen